MNARPLALAFVSALLLISGDSSGQRIVDVNVVSENFATAELPKLKDRLKPLDAELRVALYLPPPRQEPSAYLVTLPGEGPNTERRWYTRDHIRKVPGATTNAEFYQVILTNPLSVRLSEVIQQFFPRTTIYRDGDAPGSEALRIRAQLFTGFIEGGETGLV